MKTTKFFTLALIAMSFLMLSCEEDDLCPEEIWYEDSDGDGFGNASILTLSCDQPVGHVANADDVDDNDSNLNPNTVWQGPKITVNKEADTDWTLATNQDRITSNVWITRAQPGGGIFNIVTETGYTEMVSPADTEWAFGTVENINTLTFASFENTHGSMAPTIVDQDMVLHLITDNIYIDIKFTSWATGGGGSGSDGGFSYERSTMN